MDYIGVIFLGVIAFLLYRMVWCGFELNWPKFRRVDDLFCGKCGYPTRGLPSGICPECGSRFVDVGRVPARPAGHPVGAVLGWSVLLPVTMLAATQAVWPYLPPVHMRQDVVQLDGPKSGQYSNAHISVWGSGLTRPVSAERACVSFAPASLSDDPAKSLRVDWDVPMSPDATAQFLARNMEPNGYSIGPLLQQEIAEIAAYVHSLTPDSPKALAAPRSHASMKHFPTMRQAVPGIYGLGAVFLGLLAWLLGVAVIERRWPRARGGIN